MAPQPTTEHFENLLATELLKLNPQQPLWLEDESINIGRAQLPKPFYDQMQEKPTIVMDVPRPERVRKLAQEYCQTDKIVLETAILKIQKRLGGLATKEAIGAVATGDMEKMVDIVLAYYDKAYSFEVDKKKHVLPLKLQTIDPEENAAQILQFAKNNNLL